MALVFKYKPRIGYIGSGTIRFLRYGLMQISKPTVIGTLTYNGSTQSPTWSGYDSTTMTIGGTTSATNAGTYITTFTPKDGYCWDSEGSDISTIVISWTINKASGVMRLNVYSLAIDAPKTGSSTIALTWTGDGTLTATSSNTGVCTVSLETQTSAVVYLVSSGSSTVTVTISEGANYTSASATCAVTCTQSSAMLDQFYVLPKAITTFTEDI